MLKNYFVTAIRNIYRNKVFSVINFAGMAIGLATAILIFVWVLDETSYDNFHTNKDNIYRIIVDFETNSQASICGALAPTIKDEIPEITDAVRLWSGWETQIYYNENTVKSKGSFSETSLFNIFSFPILEGSEDQLLHDGHSIVITQSTAQRLFGSESPVGKTVQIKNRRQEKEDFHVTAVIEDLPSNSHIQFGFLFSFNLLKEWYRPDYAERWSNYSFYTYVLTDEHADKDKLTGKINTIFNAHKESTASLHIEPLKDVYHNPSILNRLGPTGNGLYVKLFLILGILVLVVAGINYVNLATAQSVKRLREFGLRKVIGAGKTELLFQNIGESILTAFISLPIAIFIIELINPVFNDIIGRKLFVDYSNPQIMVGLFGLIVLIGLLSGMYPAMVISSILPANILRSSAGGLTKLSSFRKTLVIFQFSLSIVIIISTVIISMQMKFIQDKDLGFNKENIVYAWIPGTEYKVLKRELVKNSNIVSVAGSGAQLDWIGWWSGINKWDGKVNDDYISFGILEVGYDYLATYQMQIESGRYYSEDFPSDPENSIVINHAAVEAMNLNDPVGKTVTYNGRERTIVGVVKDFNYESLHEQIGPMLFVLYPKQLNCLGIRISDEDLAGTISYINSVFERDLPGEIIDLKFLDKQLDTLYKDETARGKLFFLFSFISISIALLGLVGLATYSIEQRTKEIGIRKVLGASVIEILIAMTKEYLIWVVISNFIATPIANYFMNKWLQNFAYKIDIEWWVFVTAGAIALLIALATISYQAVKAALANPVESLKCE